MANFGRNSFGNNGPIQGNAQSTYPTSKPMPKKHGKKGKKKAK
jgi:hypothetical protein